MRGALRGAWSRVDRLAERLLPAPDAWVARLGTMSDEELHGRLADMVEERGGADACFAQMGFDVGKYPELQRILRERQASPGARDGGRSHSTSP